MSEKKLGAVGRRGYTDAQIRDVLSVAPTRANAEAKAAAYGRTPNAIKQIWWWANASLKDIQQYEKRQTKGRHHSYVRQIYMVRRAIGWVTMR